MENVLPSDYALVIEGRVELSSESIRALRSRVLAAIEAGALFRVVRRVGQVAFPIEHDEVRDLFEVRKEVVVDLVEDTLFEADRGGR